MKNILILGSTGSIGTQALEVCDEINYNISGLTAHSNIKLLEEQARRFNPNIVCIYDDKYFKDLKFNLRDTNIKILSKMEGILECCAMQEVDTILNALIGIAGLIPTIEGIKNKKDIAIANKESIVTAGKLINELSKKYNSFILPIDSEHSAILQALRGNKKDQVNRIILTSSGGPFFGKTYDELKNVTVNQALNHPNWSMGKKITIDSATLMNKGLEFIEAVNIFELPPEKIEILVHRQSIIHSLVEYNDRSIIAQMSVADMKIPIQYALTYPDRMSCNVSQLDFLKYNNLTFDPPDLDTFICLKSCIKAIKLGGLYPALINGVNEQAVELFLNNKISFLDIGNLVEKSLDIKLNNNYNLEEIIKVDKIAREYVLSNL